MRILYIANIRLPTEKAHGLHIMKMCEAFSGAGSSVTLVVPKRFNHLKDSPFAYYSVKKNFKIISLPTLDLVRFGRIGFLVEVVTFSCFSLWYASFHAADVIYSRDAFPLYLLSFVKRNLVFEVHTKQRGFFLKRVFQKGKAFFFITKGLLQYYEKMYPVSHRKVCVEPDAFDTNLFEKKHTVPDIRKVMGIPNETFVVGHIGKFTTMGEDKGIEDLLHGFSIALKKAYQSMHLLLVGLNPEEKEYWTKKIHSYEISSNSYTLIEHVPHSDVPGYLTACNVLIMNYPKTEHYSYFMSPLKLFEYAASDVPVITTDLPAVREILDERTAFFIPPEDSEALSEKLCYVASHQDDARDKAQQALALIQKYSWSNRAKRILEAIKI